MDMQEKEAISVCGKAERYPALLMRLQEKRRLKLTNSAISQ